MLSGMSRRTLSLVPLLWTVTGACAQESVEAPITRVVMFRSGVSYVERTGSVEGKGSLTISFKTNQINDLLKSLIVQDLDGGKVLPVTYGSKDPVSRTLQSFAIDVSDNPSREQLLERLRGVEVELGLNTETIVGRVLSVESRQVLSADGKQLTTEHYLNLSTDGSVQTVALAQVTAFRIRDERIASELQQALEALAGGLDNTRKPVTLSFQGQGKRRVRLAYVTEMPVWKMAYRLALDEDEKPFLQGWAIVENTTENDWRNVSLSLVSGQPVSFIQDLYQPLYAPRPVVETPLYRSLRPRAYAGALEHLEREEAGGEAADKDARRRAKDSPRGPVRGEKAKRGLGGGYGGGGLGGALAKPLAAAPVPATKLRRSGVSSMSTGQEVGALFEYRIDQPVSLARQKSAMIPIVNQSVDGWQVSVYNPSVQSRYPLHGLRLKNTTGLTLMGGPVTVYDGGAYGGDALIEDLEAGGSRLLTYAVDREVEVAVQPGIGPRQVVSLKIVRGVLTETVKMRELRNYTIRNRDDDDRVLLVEQPLRSGWRLTQPEKADEQTRSLYRFRVEAAANKTTKFTVQEERPQVSTVALSSAAPDRVAIYLKNPAASQALKTALQEVIRRQRDIAALQAESKQKQARIDAIFKDQSRIRENMVRLDRNSALYKRYVQRFNDQEDELDRLRTDKERLDQQVKQQREQLNDYLAKLTVE